MQNQSDVMNDSIKWWLGYWYADFEKNKDLLEVLNPEAESRLDAELIEYLSEHPGGPGHDFEHHDRVRTFTTIIGTANNESVYNIQACRYAAMLHDHLKVVGKGGGGSHNWPELRILTKELMNNAKIDSRITSDVTRIIEEHETNDPSKRSRVGNILYEGDTVDITFLPRCFDVAQSLPKFYPTMSRIIEDYTSYQIDPSKPVTDAGKKMFKMGKEWTLPTLENLKSKLGNTNLENYFQFLNTNWRKNANRTPAVLSEALEAYEENIPHYEMKLI